MGISMGRLGGVGYNSSNLPVDEIAAQNSETLGSETQLIEMQPAEAVNSDHPDFATSQPDANLHPVSTSQTTPSHLSELEQLKQQNQQYLSLVNLCKDVIFQTDSQGRWTFLNQAWEEITGFAIASCLGKSLLDFIHDDDRDRSLDVFQAFLAGNATDYRYETRCLTQKVVPHLKTITPNHGNCWLEVHIRPLLAADGTLQGTSGILRDITARKRAEAGLQHRERFFATVVAVQQELLALDGTGTSYGKILKRLGQIAGASRVYVFENQPDTVGGIQLRQQAEWSVSDTPFATTHPLLNRLTQEDAFLHWLSVLERGGVVSQLVTSLPKLERQILEAEEIQAILILPLMVRGQFWGLLGFENSWEAREWKASEIDLLRAAAGAIALHRDRQRVEQELRASEAKFRQVAENLGEILWLEDLGSAERLYISPAYETIWGRSCESLYQEPDSWLEAIHNGDRPHVLHALQQKWQGHYNAEYRIVQPDGTLRWVSDRSFPIRDQQGQIYRLVGIIEDITDRKQIEVEIRKALEKEKELNELKSSFVSMVSHEFRTPLSAIVLSISLLERFGDQASEAKRKEYFHRIRASAKRINQLLEDVLVVGAAEAGKLDFNPEPLELVPFCTSLVEDLQLTLGTGHRLQLVVEGKPSTVCLDSKLLQHILINLLSNACKYSPQHDTVTFILSFAPDSVGFCIQDQGIGIPIEDQSRLFESFQRASNVGSIPGTGLGLSIIKRCVDLHNGTIHVESTVGVGTTFTVTLPPQPAPTEQETRTE